VTVGFVSVVQLQISAMRPQSRTGDVGASDGVSPSSVRF
jgi:hypothetical protein